VTDFAFNDMLALSASERACYDYPDDTELAKAQRAAFIAGAIWAQPTELISDDDN
jgi:hypothetical protein